VGGDWTECIEGQAGQSHNISEDPLFCGLESDDLTLMSRSPCAPEHSEGCFQIGAWPVGCEDPSSAGRGAVAAATRMTVAPNPTSGSCLIRIESADRSSISDARVAGEGLMQVLEVSGRLVRQLDLGRLSAGASDIVWDTRAEQGRAVASGIYFVRRTTPRSRIGHAIVVTR